MKTVVSFSGGKDSTAMLLRLLELGEPIDEIIFADSGFEFPELYDYIKRIEKYIGRSITILQPQEGLFEKWFAGEITRGKYKGKIRGLPMLVNPCWWTRESKLLPLQKAHKDANIVYVGIAYDERERMSKVDGKLRYPLVDWKWTEQDCIDYLNKKGLFNPLYVNFGRLGCFWCPKQGEGSLFVVWKLYPGLWNEMKMMEKKNFEFTGRYLKLLPLKHYENKFEVFGKPSCSVPRYDCERGCDSVAKAFKEKQKGLNNWFC